MQQYLPDTEQQGGYGGAQFPGTLFQPGQLFIGKPNRLAGAACPVASWKIRGQGQGLAPITQLLYPPSGLGAGLIAVQPLLLPGGIIRVLNFCGRCRQGIALMGLPIQLAQLRQQQLHGNTVTDDVMLHQQQVIALIGQLDGQHPQQVVTGQIERLTQHLMLHFFCSGFRGIFLRQILPLNLDNGVIKDALTWSATRIHKTGA